VSNSLNASIRSEIINPPHTSELGLEQPLSSIHGKYISYFTVPANINKLFLSLTKSFI